MTLGSASEEVGRPAPPPLHELESEVMEVVWERVEASVRDVMQALNERELALEQSLLSPDQLARLIQMVDEGRLTVKNARALVAELVTGGGDPEVLVAERGLAALYDAGLIDQVVSEVLAENAENLELFRSGEHKLLNFLIGQVMRKTRGSASPAAVREALLRALRS